MARTQATLHYLEASLQAFKDYEVTVQAAHRVKRAAEKQIDEAYWAAGKQASDVREVALNKASELYEAEKEEEEEQTL